MPSRRRYWLLGLTVVLVLLSWRFALRAPQRPARGTTLDTLTDRGAPDPPLASLPADSGVPGASNRAVTPSRTSGPVASCAERVERQCLRGDSYWLDGCGNAEKAEECGNALCRDGTCERGPAQACLALSAVGRCEGDVAKGCVGGMPYARDCAALGKRCVDTQEGAICRAAGPDDCDRHGDLPRCEGDTLLSCRDGLLARTACDVEGGECGTPPGGSRPTCHRIEPRASAPSRSDTCGPCGCETSQGGQPSRPTGEGAAEACDGEDEDGDGYIDEGATCAPIPIVAFVITDDGGTGSYGLADIEEEIARTNAVLGTAPGGLALSAELVEVVSVRRPQWLKLSDGALGAVLADPAIRLARDTFFVPLVFTDVVESGDTPKLGVSTLPNGRCGGRRINPLPEPNLGGIVVAKGRAPTTVAHELGHYLGLCHTHFDFDGALTRIATWPVDDRRNAFQACQPGCVLEGDGMCDTPPDPGPAQCGYGPECQALCATPATPDTGNVMSYYTDCRTALSPMQARELRRGMALRRGFDRCRSPEQCPCDPLAPGCPKQMTCRPTATGFGCDLDGPRDPGAACAHHGECGGGSLCASDGHCRVPCDPALARCPCQADANLGLRVCVE